MSRPAIAPVLGALLKDLRAEVKPGKAGAGDAQVLRLAADELRVLKAAARALLDISCGCEPMPCRCLHGRLQRQLRALAEEPA